MKQSHQNQLISSSEALLLRIWAYEKPLSGVAGSGLERAEQDAGRRKAWRTQCPLRGEAIRKGVCKKDCVNPLEWNRRMEGREDEI
ncbi:hypothetical protein Q502_00580 [Mesotoga sp. Brook.08.YT.4.2.5.2.]|nr:hypothetical protein M388_15065 [Mesotoga sp. Brook.08.YT.4.2.5.4.]RDI94332.1 hypothetical protein Q502_00580 [Mesotoga sp. Brook.08.YT.4.2.5.2.]